MAFKAGAIYGEAKLDTSKWNKGLKSLSGSAIKGAKIAAAAFVGMMAVAVKQANDYQKAMSNVASITDEATVSTVAISKALLTMNPELGDATELAKGLYQAFSAGAQDTEEAMEITTNAAMFAKAALTDTFTAVDVLTTAVNAYGRETMDTTKAADIFFTTVKEGKITGDQLANTIGNSIPLFATMGIELEELTAGIAAMTKQGINSAKATTQLNAIVNAFIKPSEAMTAALHSQGIESGSALLGAEGLSGALDFLDKVTEGNTEELAQLIPNIRGLRGVMALTGVGGQEFTEILESMSEASGSNARAFAEQEKTFATLKSSLDNGLVVLGNIGKTFVDEIAQGATAASEGMIAFMLSSQGGELVGNIIARVAGTFAALKAALKPIVDRIGPAWQGIVSTLKESMATLGLNTEKSAGGAKVLAIVSATLASALTIVGKVIEHIITTIANMINVFKESGEVIGTFFKALTGRAKFSEVRTQAEQASEAIKGFTVGIADGVTDIITTTVDEFKTFGDRVRNTATDVEVAYTTTFKSTRDTIVNNWDEITAGQFDFNSNWVTQMEAFRDQQKAILQKETEDREEEERKRAEASGEAAEERERTAEELAAAEIAAEDRKQREIKLAEIEAALERIKLAKETKRELERLWAERTQTILTSQEAFHAASYRATSIFNERNKITQEEFMALDIEAWKANWESKIELVRTSFDLIKDTFTTVWSVLTDTVSGFLDLQKNKIESSYATELALLDQKLEDEIITQEQYDTEKETLDDDRLTKLNETAKKEFKANRRNQIASAVIAGAQSIMGWWGQAPILGPIAGPIFAGIMTGIVGIATAAQVAMIAQQQFVPMRAEGGTVNGVARINEKGGEIVNLPDGSLVIPNDISRQIANSSGNAGTTIHVSFAGANIHDDMSLKKITREVSKSLGKELRSA